MSEQQSQRVDMIFLPNSENIPNYSPDGCDQLALRDVEALRIILKMA
jgi:hypothetical protein